MGLERMTEDQKADVIKTAAFIKETLEAEYQKDPSLETYIFNILGNENKADKCMYDPTFVATLADLIQANPARMEITPDLLRDVKAGALVCSAYFKMRAANVQELLDRMEGRETDQAPDLNNPHVRDLTATLERMIARERQDPPGAQEKPHVKRQESGRRSGPQ